MAKGKGSQWVANMSGSWDNLLKGHGLSLDHIRSSYLAKKKKDGPFQGVLPWVGASSVAMTLICSTSFCGHTKLGSMVSESDKNEMKKLTNTLLTPSTADKQLVVFLSSGVDARLHNGACPRIFVNKGCKICALAIDNQGRIEFRPLRAMVFDGTPTESEVVESLLRIGALAEDASFTVG